MGVVSLQGKERTADLCGGREGTLVSGGSFLISEDWESSGTGYWKSGVAPEDLVRRRAAASTLWGSLICKKKQAWIGVIHA
jgi:hypothetical protein